MPRRTMTIASKQRPSKKGGIAKMFVVVGVLLVVGLLGFLFKDKIMALFNPISVVASITGTDLKGTDGRTNVLILGSDKRSTGNITSQLTDTILVASIGKVDNDIVLISIPRDLWVQTPSEYYTKINSVYAYGGTNDLMPTVENVLGIPVHYYAVVTFDLFRDAVNALGGVEIDVERPFTDYYYPVEGKENDLCGKNSAELEKLKEVPDYILFPCRYETVTFKAGPQTMNGETALKFARSRKGDNEEGTDFARAKRQQKVIMALKDKALSLQTLINPSKLKELYDAYSNNVDTNINFGAIQSFYLLSQQLDFSRMKSVVLDDRSLAAEGGLLYAPEDTTLYGGQYVLIPRTGDYSQIHAYVQKYLFGDK